MESPPRRIAIAYATREGQTRRVAEGLARIFESRGAAPTLIDVANAPPAVDLSGYEAAIVAASVHVGRHEPEMARFVVANRPALSGMVSAFLSVSLSEAGVEDEAADALRRAQAALDVRRMINAFLSQTGWQPGWIVPVAGAVAYAAYNPIVRLAMRSIVKRAGGDPRHDREYTDWRQLETFVDSLLARLAEARPATAPGRNPAPAS